MSATGRGDCRVEHDVYPTPAWCIHRLLERCVLPGGRWIDPCAGDGAIIQAVSAVRTDVRFDAIELRPECAAPLRLLTPRVGIGDFLRGFSFSKPRYDVLLTNPPYSLAMEFIEAGLEVARTVVMLLRYNFLGSEGRAEFFHERMPHVFGLPNRPTFSVVMSVDRHGKLRRTTSDATEYAFLRFDRGVRRRRALVEVLDLMTPEPVLRAAREAAPVIWTAEAEKLRSAA